MIRYPVSTSALERLINSRVPNWLRDAAERTHFHRIHRGYFAKSETLPDGKKAREFWNRIKGVFITAQYGKCAYCESKPESSSIQWDIDHFRPKSGVVEWRYNIQTGPGMPEGYYMLAYDFGNYAAACKTCNSIYKRNFFPIEHHRIVHGQTIADHQDEGAFLIYPLGDMAEDPEQLIAFNGVDAIARDASPRGQLVIDFFQLNREGLQRSRAEWLFYTFRTAFDGYIEGTSNGGRAMEWLLSYEAQYTSCSRCFLDLCLNDPDAAEHQYQKMEIILKKSPRLQRAWRSPEQCQTN
jgi:hypothetical protein